ncbi:stress activated MAP kinase interacting protein [Aspergillus taichungensis]|uniref:Stress activated MAP kinase interacting protein n=1 Tax=Aspergillus taichungensis TaxID=482145 RepID=A0A2J5I4Q2_9EURO|nr:stress activated MAP kinase interacting protein [Aspergillus taichungensis]
MSLLHNEDFTIWQLRTSYLSTIKDGIGDRLINVNNSVLNTPGFRAAGWSSASAHPGAAAAHIKRTYSPPIPTTAAVSSEYYNLGVFRDTSEARNYELREDGEDEEGGMVTGKSTADITGRRNNLRAGKKPHRRERQQPEHLKPRDAEEDDSSDLSDESDDDGESASAPRPANQIKFTKMPIRTRAGSSPIRSTDRQEGPQVMVTSPSHPTMGSHYRTGSLGTAVTVDSRPRRDTTTTTSSDMSSDNDLEYKRRHIQFSNRDQVIEPSRLGRGEPDDRIDEESDEEGEDSGAESVGSALSSEFGATAGSASLLEDVEITGGLDSSSPMALMHKLQGETGSQQSTSRKVRAPAPELHDLPPPRPISTVQPVSLLSQALNARKRAPTNPVEKFAVLSGKGLTDALNIKLYLPFSANPEEPLELPLARESKLAEQPAPVTVVEAIGLALWRYAEEGRDPAIERHKLTVNRWALRMMEDGEVEYDFPALGRSSPMTDFTSNNNNRAAGARGRSRGNQYDEFALVQASEAEFVENERLYPMDSPTVPAEDTGDAAAVAATAAPTTPSATMTSVPPSANSPGLPSKGPRPNPILGQPFSSALNDNTLTPADRPAVPVSHATPRMGVSKTLRIRFINLEGSTQMTTLNTSTDSYIAEILDSVCKRWGLDKGNYLLKVMGSNTIAPLDRTVEALGHIVELDLVRRRFGPLTGSPGSSSPNAPLLIEQSGTGGKPGTKKGKKGEKEKRMLHPLTQKQDLIGGYYRRYHVFRKQSMSFTASNHRILTFDNDYMHIIPGDTGKTGSDTKTRSISFNDVVGCKVSRRHPKNFRVVVLRGNDANEQKRYDFEAQNTVEAEEIVDEIKKNMAHYRI